jgi:hypothetical protein
VTPATVVARGVTVGALTETVQRYCGQCHNPTSKRGNLDLRGYSVEGAATDAAVTEKMIRKLRTDMMPPPGSRRPNRQKHTRGAGTADAPRGIVIVPRAQRRPPPPRMPPMPPRIAPMRIMPPR